jgi:ATP-dependent RNA helicase DeaD
MEFRDLGLQKEILDVLTRQNFRNPLEVQEKLIPLALSGKDVVFTSRTGSGKTLAYLLGFLGKINPKQGVQMLVMVPTRELCIQVGKEMDRICEPLGIKIGMLYGGRDVPGDYRTLSRRNQIMVGTPGRLILHVNEKKLKIGDVKYLVFDESDQMFDNGFYDNCVYLRQRVSRVSQIIFSSATITEKVESFIENEMPGHVLLRVGELIPERIVQEKLYCEKIEKNAILLQLFKRRFKQAMVFCNTRQKSTNIALYLKQNGYNAVSLNGNLSQVERLNHLNLFKDGKIRVLVTTDIAARGLHIKTVDMIINYDVPTKHEFYVHRIGRTGRKDAVGYAITLICPEDVERFENIEFEYKLKVPEIENPVKKESA